MMVKTPLRRKLRAELRKRKGRQGYSWKSIAKQTGINYERVRLIGSGDTPNPGLDVVETLLDYFRENPVIEVDEEAEWDNDDC